MNLVLFFVYILISDTVLSEPQYLSKCSLSVERKKQYYCFQYEFNDIDCFPWLTDKCKYETTTTAYCAYYICEVCHLIKFVVL